MKNMRTVRDSVRETTTGVKDEEGRTRGAVNGAVQMCRWGDRETATSKHIPESKCYHNHLHKVLHVVQYNTTHAELKLKATYLLKNIIKNLKKSLKKWGHFIPIHT